MINSYLDFGRSVRSASLGIILSAPRHRISSLGRAFLPRPLRDSFRRSEGWVRARNSFARLLCPRWKRIGSTDRTSTALMTSCGWTGSRSRRIQLSASASSKLTSFGPLAISGGDRPTRPLFLKTPTNFRFWGRLAQMCMLFDL